LRLATLQNLVDRIDQKRRALLERVSQMDPEQLTANPVEGKWSILQIIEHLVISERDVMPGLSNPADLVPGKKNFKDRALFRLVMVILRSPIPVKTPSRGMVPRGKKSLDELRAMWDQNHEWLRSFVAGLDQSGESAAVFSHPVAGPLSPEEALRMLDVHLTRHIKQIDGLEKSARES